MVRWPDSPAGSTSLKGVYIGSAGEEALPRGRLSTLVLPASPAFLVRTPRCSHLRSSLGPRGVLRGVVSSLFPSVFCSRRVEGVVAGRPLSPPRAFSVVNSLSAHWTPPSSGGALLQRPPPPAVMGTLAFQQTVGEGRASACEILMTQRFVVVYGHGVRALCSSPACLHAGGMQKAGRQTVSSETAVSACGIFI